MNQSKQISKKLLVAAAVVAIVAMLGAVAYAFQASGTNGSITVTGTIGSEADLNSIAARVQDAITLKNATDDATGPNPNSTRTHWALAAHHAAFQLAIDEAAEYVKSVGDTFELNVNIAGNTGFGSMIFCLGLPPQLELTAVRPAAGFTERFAAPLNWNSTTGAVSPAITGEVFAGWGGTSGTGGNLTGNGVLLTYTLRVRNNTGLPANGVTAPITLSFKNNASGFENPTTYNAQPLSMSIEGTTILPINPSQSGGQVINLGSVKIS